MTVVTMPHRIQRKRTAGWKKPEGAVIVDRTTKWGNPFKVGEKIRRDSPLWPYIAEQVPGGAHGLAALAPSTPAVAVDLYASWVIEQPHLMLAMKEDLAGKDLVCWCAEGSPCHASDVLLPLANSPEVSR